MSANVLAYFVRHGATNLNQNHAFRGPLNPPLDGQGIQDAGEIKDLFKNTEFGDAYTSDRLRAETTAHMVLDDKDIEPISTNLLRAWNVGFLGGKPKAGNESTIQYYQDNPNVRIPDGESLNEFRQRVDPMIKHLIKRGAETGVPSVAFAHSSIIHEVGHIIHGNHNAALVRPGGVIAVTHEGGKLNIKTIFKPDTKKQGYGN